VASNTDTSAATEAREEGRFGGSVPLTVLAGLVAVSVLLPLLWIPLAGARVGVDGALDLLVRPTTVEVVVNSALMTATVTALSVVLAVPLAYLTVRTDLPFRRFFSVALAMPLVIPSYIGAFAFVSAFGPRGTLQDVLAPLGVETIPTIYGLGGSTLVITLYTYPYVFITTRAALKSLDTRLVEAARSLGHSRWGAFRRVTVAQIRPAVAAGALLVALYALSDFGTPAIMRYDVFTRVIYVEYNTFGRNMAALLSLLLVVGTAGILGAEQYVRGEGRLSTSRGHGDASSRVRLGRWRWVAVLPCLAVSGLALLVPLGVLGLWLARTAGTTATGLAFQPSYALNSVAIALAAALAATVLGLPIAHLSARDDSRLSDLFERASYVGYAVPGVVVGLALVFLGARFGGSLYQVGLLAFPLLVFGYVVRFLPQAVGSTRASILRVSPALPEAARTLGRSRLGAFRSVTLPLIAPGQVGGAALVFLTTMKELPVTLVLRPAGFETLVTQVWQATQAGYYGQAAMPALVLLVVSALSMLVLLSMEGYDVK
jgi:iron(III) transport system permease protein